MFLALAGAAAVASVHVVARADAPAGRYTASGGTVLDSKTHLTWQQAASSSLVSWANAKTYCAGLGSTLGGTGWRLPTEKELLSLVDYSQSTSTASDQSVFSALLSGVWSATPLAGSPTTVWVITPNGTTFTVYTVNGGAYARCVR